MRTSRRFFDLFLFLFIFTTFNRTFRLIGFDPRYIGMVLAVVLIAVKLIENKGKISISHADLCIILFFIAMFLSLIQWNYNKIFRSNDSELINLVILYAYNFLAFCVFTAYRQEIESPKVCQYIIVSGTVLIISIVLVYLGIDIPKMFIDKSARVGTIGTVDGEHHNLFGQPVRVAGFAEDANYATLFCVIFIVYAIMSIKSKIKRIILITAGMIGISLSFSRTILLGVIIAGFLLIISRLLKSRANHIEIIIFVCIFLAAFMMPYLHLSVGMHTIATRLKLWQKASWLFSQSPLFGAGMGAFRYYNNSFYSIGWMVQCHSTYWQILSECGVIGAILFSLAVCRLLNQAKNGYYLFLLLIYIVFAFTFETLYFQFFVMLCCLVQLDTGSICLEVKEND